MKSFDFKSPEETDKYILPGLVSRLYVSVDAYEELVNDDGEEFKMNGLDCAFFPDKLNEWLKDALRQKFIEAYLIKQALPLSSVVLWAHGFQNQTDWCFANGKFGYRVQEWVNIMDGKYGLLILICCNEGKSLVVTNQSLILQPSSIIGFTDTFGDQANFGTWNLYSPGGQEIDDYTLEYELNSISS